MGLPALYNRNFAGWGKIIWDENQGDDKQCYRDFFRLFDTHFEELRSAIYYDQLLELYQGIRKQEAFDAQ